MFLQGWVNGILINESSVYGTLCIVLLKILNMGLYFSEIDTRGWPYRRQDLLLPFNHSFARLSCRLATLVIGFEDWIWVLIASVPGLCILLIFKFFSKDASLVMRKPAFCILCKNKGTNQLTAKLISAFVATTRIVLLVNSLFCLVLKFQASSHIH